MTVTFKQKIGCWFNERWKTELVLRTPALAKKLGLSWLDLCNRNEKTTIDKKTNGRVCHWKDSSQLTVARFFPYVGARLLHFCEKEYPFQFSKPNSFKSSASPDVAFVLGVRGTARLLQFKTTLASLMAQQGCTVEIIVVEHSQEPEFKTLVPNGIHYIHIPEESAEAGFNKSRCINVGVQNANAKVILIHDADMVVPTRYAAAILDRFSHKLDAIKVPRFLFNLRSIKFGTCSIDSFTGKESNKFRRSYKILLHRLQFLVRPT